MTKAAESPKKFKLKYAPDLGAFHQHAGKDPIDQLKFMADEGFSAMFDNGLMGKPPELQEKIAKEMTRLGMTLGPFVMYADFSKATLVTPDEEIRKQIVNLTKQAVETSKRANAKWALIAPGLCSQRLEWDYQTANLVDNLRRCAEVAEPAGMVIVIEPLNWWANHPGLFLQKIPQAYLICKAVNSPVRARSSMTCTISRSPRETSFPILIRPIARSRRSTSATTPAATSPAPARSTTRTSSGIWPARATRARCAWSTARANGAKKANAP